LRAAGNLVCEDEGERDSEVLELMPEQRTEIDTGSTIEGRYRLERTLGAGGMAEVWLASDTRLDRLVAVKLLSESLVDDPGFVERFGREARIAAGLSHPALVPVHDLGITGERPFLVMEYVEGETLADRIDRAPETIDVEALATEMLVALEHIHEAGIIHRDVKPGNILYGDAGRIRLTDFGIARMSGADTQITQSGQVLGTLRYLAPELRDGTEPSPASDLYSLGVVLADCRERTGGGEVLEPLIERLRAADPARRPVSARAALRELGRLGSVPAPTPPDDRTEPLPAARRVLNETEQRRAHTPVPPASRSERGESSAEVTAGGSHPLPHSMHSSARRRGLALSGLALAAAIAVAVALLLSGGGDPEATDEGPGSASQSAQSDSADAGAEDEPPAAEAVPEPAASADPGEGARLNDQGFGLLQSGQAAEAVPILERAVAAFGDQTDDINYAYALFNYGKALREAGRPEDAIPVLERRLQIDNQRPTVRAELRRARADAGQ
jgi:eukaryotic-like serine/threonine-protein kinase